LRPLDAALKKSADVDGIRVCHERISGLEESYQVFTDLPCRSCFGARTRALFRQSAGIVKDESGEHGENDTGGGHGIPVSPQKLAHPVSQRIWLRLQRLAGEIVVDVANEPLDGFITALWIPVDGRQTHHVQIGPLLFHGAPSSTAV